MVSTPKCITFKTSVLEHVYIQRIMFEAISVTNENAYVPGTGHGEDEEHDDGVDDGNGDAERGTEHVTRGANKRPSPSSGRTSSPFGKKRKSFRDNLIKRLMETYEKKILSSNSATSNVIAHVREEIGTMLEQVMNDGAEEGSDEHYYATQLLKKKENRDMFVEVFVERNPFAYYGLHDTLVQNYDLTASRGICSKESL
jgi:hypothetical protein